MNAVYVSRHYHSEDKRRDTFVCDSLNWIGGQPPSEVVSQDGPPSLNSSIAQQAHLDIGIGAIATADKDDAGASALMVKVRHGPNMYRCKRFELREDGNAAFVHLSEDDQGLAAGQFAVFYRHGVCLGSGIIREAVSGQDAAAE